MQVTDANFISVKPSLSMVNPKFLEVNDGVLESVVLILDYPSIEQFKDDVNNVKIWMESQQHLPEVMDEKKIQNFLLLNKGRLEEVRKKITNYYTVRSTLTDIYGEINPKFPYIQDVMDGFYFVMLPKLTKDMHRVFFYKTRIKNKLSFFDPVLGIRYLVNLIEIRLLEDVTYGDVFVIDGKDVPLTAFLHITPSIIRKALVTIYKNIFSSRVKAIYIFNTPFFIDKVLYLFKSILKPKIFKRIHFCKNAENVLEKIGKEVMPRDYGGEEECLEDIQKATRKKFEEYELYFDELDKLKVDES